MLLSGLLEVFRRNNQHHALIDALQSQQHVDFPVIRAARPYVLAGLAGAWNGPILFLTAQIKRAYNVAEQLPVWLRDRPILGFAEPAPFFYERAPWGDVATRSRLETLAALTDKRPSGQPPIVVSSARALMQRTMPVSDFFAASLVLQVGQRLTLDALLGRCVRLGYDAVSLVVESGTFSRRGGIVDIFPTSSAQPVRVEFFGDEIDTLRLFDPSTQRTTGKMERIVITPAREALPEHAPQIAERLGEWFKSLPLNTDAASPASDAEALAQGTLFPYLEFYLPFMYQQAASLLDYADAAGSPALIVVDDLDSLRDAVQEIAENAEQGRAERIKAGQLHPDHPLPYVAWEQFEPLLSAHRLVNLGYATALPEDDGASPSARLFAPGARYGGQLKSMLNQLRRLRDDGSSIVVVTEQAGRLASLWREQESHLPTVQEITDAPPTGGISFVNGTLSDGWTLHTDPILHLLSDAEIFGWSRPEPRRRKSGRRQRVPEANYADLKPGDYVVHVDYGVGRFAGMRRRTIESNEREYMLIEYAGTDQVYVPIHQVDRLTRYVGVDDKPPSLSPLGEADWNRIKARAKKAVEEEARDLLALYAQRAAAPGYGYAPDSHYQHEMEAAFPFVETEDQLRAVREVKADMEQAHPMDRLICGDVGYGKTEVALRAAFKAVLDGKQVAVLVPTTVLAQQHYETFSQRLGAFPVRVEMLSRFRTKEEQTKALRQLVSGEIDVMIGTHRLLSDDVKFRDLGLAIIDEEQRFGVKHKEHFKKLRTQVDVLTLTATPIPRTLYMSLTGVRDISMIQTPPEDRLPVITHVGTYEDGLVRQAVLRELERGGQIFYVHNRVQALDGIREHLERIIPEARIVTGHGQMNERALENAMLQFAHGEADVLLATSIIESGLDIPNANTLIVDRADLFGMAQLYQIRGRVGRSASQAYAYFFHPRKLTEEARARLEALAEHTDLGSGYQIAMRDLELRGAGGILSTRQTGHVAAVGLHLYTQMLSSAVAKLKDGDEAAPATYEQSSMVIDLPLPAYLPEGWIDDISLRLQIYRRIADLNAPPEVVTMREELRDRFGELPGAVEGLLYQIDVKLRAQAAGATAVLARDGQAQIKLPYLPEINRAQLQRRLGGDVEVTRTAVLLPLKGDWRTRLLDVLSQLRQDSKVASGI